MSDVRIAYTAYCVNDWRDVMSRHMSMLRDSVLSRYDADVSIFAFPAVDGVASVVDALGHSCTIHELPDNQYEFPALRSLASKPAAVNLYLHTKGVAHPESGPRDEARVKSALRRWDRYMSRFCLGMCDTCVAQLASADCAGVALRLKSVLTAKCLCHYSGNFWWSSGRHLHALRASPHIISPRSRYDAEAFIGSIHGTYASLCNHGARGGLYRAEYNPDTLPLDIKVVTV
jgi:hypothetical protein